MLGQGTYIDLPEKEYRSWEAINYSSLADFNESQDHALLEKPARSYFEEGKAFELLVEDVVKGTTKFAERFFIADAPGAMPDDLAGWIEQGEDLRHRYHFNQDGEKNKRYKRLHAWLDECRKTPGKMPMGTDQMARLNTMVDNFLKMQPLTDKGSTASLSEILPLAFFQVPLVWYVQTRPGRTRMRKKALIDCMVITDTTIYAFDIKTAADIKRFLWMLKDKYWIQQAHYTEGLRAIFPEKTIRWRFLVSPKTKPYVAQPFYAELRGMADYGEEVYFHLCERYRDWLDAGRPPRGWKEAEAVNIYYGNIG